MRKILTWLPMAVLLILMCSTSTHADKWSDYPDFGSGAVDGATDTFLIFDNDAAGAQMYQYFFNDLVTDLSAPIAADIGAGELADNIVGVADMTHEDHGDVTWASGAAVVEDDSHAHIYSNIDAFTEANLYTRLSDVTEFIETNDAGVLATLNTGQGAYELYAMDQDVESDDDVTFGSVTTAAASASKISFKDSDCPGTDKDVGNIQVDYIDSDNGDGAENADMIFRITQGGVEDTVVLTFDESDDRWETDKAIASTGLLSGGVVTNSKSGAYTLGADNAVEAYGGVLYATANMEFTLPEIAAGMSFTIIDYGASIIVLDPDAVEGTEDRIILDGTLLAQGGNVTSTETTGDMIVCTYNAAHIWYCASGSPDGDHWTGP